MITLVEQYADKNQQKTYKKALEDIKQIEDYIQGLQASEEKKDRNKKIKRAKEIIEQKKYILSQIELSVVFSARNKENGSHYYYKLLIDQMLELAFANAIKFIIYRSDIITQIRSDLIQYNITTGKAVRELCPNGEWINQKTAAWFEYNPNILEYVAQSFDDITLCCRDFYWIMQDVEKEKGQLVFKEICEFLGKNPLDFRRKFRKIMTMSFDELHQAVQRFNNSNKVEDKIG